MVGQHKPDPTMRKDIYLANFENVRNFLRKQEGFVYKTNIKNELGNIDMKSINLALKILDDRIGIETNDKKQVKLKDV